MPFTYQIDPHQELVTLTFSGDLDLPDVVEARKRFQDDAAFRPGFRLLVDLRGANVRRLSSSGVRERAQEAPPVSRIAIVADPSAATFGIARMYEFMSPLAVSVFTDPGPALRWLREDR